jgi:hypothetical protein
VSRDDAAGADLPGGVPEIAREDVAMTRGLLKTEEVACLLRVDVEWVRAHRIALGAVKLGDGPKAHLRFPRDAVDAYLAARRVIAPGSSEPAAARKPRQPRRGAAPAPALRAAGERVIDW